MDAATQSWRSLRMHSIWYRKTALVSLLIALLLVVGSGLGTWYGTRAGSLPNKNLDELARIEEAQVAQSNWPEPILREMLLLTRRPHH